MTENQMGDRLIYGGRVASCDIDQVVKERPSNLCLWGDNEHRGVERTGLLRLIRTERGEMWRAIADLRAGEVMPESGFRMFRCRDLRQSNEVGWECRP